MFRKILIANRGEIAVRLIRACRDLNIRRSRFILKRTLPRCMCAWRTKPIALARLRQRKVISTSKIIDVAKRANAEALHPGYGFLAENAAFARAVTEAGLVFIGPTAEAMEIMGSKTNAPSRGN
jgi:acetyl/propionyl-CoA carboxylase alpha subunit